ncbi:glycosyltransferase [Bacteroides fragilis]|nr:glycosyltransferase [Bacteroides fragilis]
MKEVKRPVVSVVVPVYNTEPFLAECLHSLEKQTLTDIEIILVNDGSTDNSGRLLREYADKDARFVYVEQENQGLSAARNTGMEHASGHYLAFLDSDDWLAENALQVLCAIAAKTRTDIVSGNTLAVHADGQVQSWERRGRELFATGTVVSGSTYFSRVMDCRCYVPMVYNYLYRRDFIEQNGFRFEPGVGS